MLQDCAELQVAFLPNDLLVDFANRGQTLVLLHQLLKKRQLWRRGCVPSLALAALKLLVSITVGRLPKSCAQNRIVLSS